MAKFDAADRQASGEPVPEEIQRLLGDLIASATSSSGEVLDIYEAAGIPKLSLDDLTLEFIAKTQQARNPQLAIEALRKLIADESAGTTRNIVIRQRAFSERITELMKKYTNQQLTSAEVIAELVELAREVALEGNRGFPVHSPVEFRRAGLLRCRGLAVEVQGEGVLADIARELVSVIGEMTTYETSTGNAVPEVPPTPGHEPQLKAQRLKLAKLRSANGARIILGAVLGLLMIITWIVNNPAFQSGSSPSDWKSELSAADLKNTMNNGETKGAPQQTVVNGWYANDIAAVTAAQNTYIAASSARNGNLLMMLGIGVAGELIIRGAERARINRRATA